jgi:hypothetical protein
MILVEAIDNLKDVRSALKHISEVYAADNNPKKSAVDNALHNVEMAIYSL